MIRAKFLAVAAAVVLFSPGASALGPELYSARSLLAAGDASTALQILQTLPPTVDVVEARARAHVIMAYQDQPPGRCSHLRWAMEYASMASASRVVLFAQNSLRDEGCETYTHYGQTWR